MGEKRYSDHYDEAYWEKTNLLKQIDVYRIMKYQASPVLLQIAGYTRRWRPDNCLVVGCAFGFTCEVIEKEFKVPCSGIDISEFAINKARKLYDYHNIQIGDVRNMIFADDEFELLISTRTLEELDEEDVNIAASEMVRVCSKLIMITVAKGQDKRFNFQSIHPKDWWINKFKNEGANLEVETELEQDTVLVFRVTK